MRAVLMCPMLAPFHRRRLEVAREAFRANGDELLCVQTASEQTEYGWDSQMEAEATTTLFGGRDHASILTREIWREVRKALARLEPDVVAINGWGQLESWPALACAVAAGTARVLISDSQINDKPRNHMKEMIKRLFVHRCQSAFVAGTPHLEYVQRLGMPSRYCTTGCDVVDNGFFSEQARASVKTHSDREVRLLSCIRLVPVKNVSFALEALSTSEVPWRWTIAGTGPAQADIESKIAKLALAERVRLIGHVPYSELPALHARHDFYLQPSVSEPWGLAVNEAQASGMPVLLSRQTGCHRDLLQEGVNGFTFDATAPADLRRALEEAWRARERWSAMGAASQRLVEPWSLSRYATGLHDACSLALQRLGRTQARSHRPAASL